MGGWVGWKEIRKGVKEEVGGYLQEEQGARVLVLVQRRRVVVVPVIGGGWGGGGRVFLCGAVNGPGGHELEEEEEELHRADRHQAGGEELHAAVGRWVEERKGDESSGTKRKGHQEICRTHINPPTHPLTCACSARAPGPQMRWRPSHTDSNACPDPPTHPLLHTAAALLPPRHPPRPVAGRAGQTGG